MRRDLKSTNSCVARGKVLSREPAPQQVFERVCEIVGVKLIFGDAPSGMDVGSQFARSALTFSNKLARLATNRNARAGNIGRVLKGWVPSHKAAYGYIYRRDAEIASSRFFSRLAAPARRVSLVPQRDGCQGSFYKLQQQPCQ